MLIHGLVCQAHNSGKLTLLLFMNARMFESMCMYDANLQNHKVEKLNLYMQRYKKVHVRGGFDKN